MALYMKYGKLEGEVTETKHDKWIAIDSASFGSSRSTSVEVGSGQEKRHRDQPIISDLQISRTYDKSSPLLFNESVDLWAELWPSRAMQLGEGAKDIVLTMLLPTVLMLALRWSPRLGIGPATR